MLNTTCPTSGEHLICSFKFLVFGEGDFFINELADRFSVILTCPWEAIVLVLESLRGTEPIFSYIFAFV